MLKQLRNRIVNFFSELPKPILFLATCAVFLSFIISSQITHSARELGHLGEMIKQEKLILELEEGFQWQNNVMMKQHEVIQKQEAALEYYKDIINELMLELNEKLREEQRENSNRSDAANHERKTKHKNMG